MSKKTRDRRAAVARETLDVLARGRYSAPGGAVRSIAHAQQAAVQGSRLYRPRELDALLQRARARLRSAAPRDTRFEVTGESTLAAARRLIARGLCDPLCLNFASGKNPGGGFLKGSSGQEESLARASGLYPCIAQMDAMYRENRASGSPFYSDHMIYSPRVPLLRADDDSLLPEPLLCSFLTAPAVNAGAVLARQRRRRADIPEVMRQRVAKVLALALERGHRTLVLGAWGCGVFRNDPAAIAGYFAEHLLSAGGAFTDAFDRVTFAIIDSSRGGVIISPFQEAMRAGLPPRD